MAFSSRLSLPVLVERYHGDCSFVGKMGQVGRVGTIILVRLSFATQRVGINSCSNGM